MKPFSKPVIDAARGIVPADVIFEDATIFNPFTCSWDEGTLAVKDGIVVIVRS